MDTINFDKMTATEQLRWITTPLAKDDPYYDQWVIKRHEYNNMMAPHLPMLQEIQKRMGSVSKWADLILKLIDQEIFENFATLPPIDSLTLLAVVAKSSETTSKKARKMLASAGGKAAKGDDLSKFIASIVLQNPKITEHELYRVLQQNREQRRGLIEDIDEDEIVYMSKGKLKTVPTSALKHRLSRAKRKTKII